MSYGFGFVAILYAFQQCKYFENRLRSDKVTESLKVGTFLRHTLYAALRTTDANSFEQPGCSGAGYLNGHSPVSV